MAALRKSVYSIPQTSARAWRLNRVARARLAAATALFRQRTTGSRIMEKTGRETQITNRVLMIRSDVFGFNAQTAADNQFQHPGDALNDTQIRERALEEFDGLAKSLRAHNVDVIVVEDTHRVSCDAIFPNNWISFHQDGKMVLYPMMALNRRLERAPEVVASWREKLGAAVVDYTSYENEGKFLEGTGSMVLDRVNHIAYSCMSRRTHVDVLRKFCHDFAYTPVLFEAAMQCGDQYCPIYHTNVMMSVAETFAIVCLDCVRNKEERAALSDSLKESGKEIITISEDQVKGFAGNVLQLASSDGKRLFVMSTQAFNSFSPEQLGVIRSHCDAIVHSSLEIIQKHSGGGARCMIAEVFPPNYKVDN